MFPRRGIEIFRSVLGDCADIMVMNPIVVVQPRFDLRPVPSTPKFLYGRETSKFSVANNSPKSVPAESRIDEGMQFTIGNVKGQSRRGFLERYIDRIYREAEARREGGHDASPNVADLLGAFCGAGQSEQSRQGEKCTRHLG
jgi:hypothetical protein